MLKALLIGGAGYIGSSLYTYLVSKKLSVDTVDLEWFGNHVNKRNIKSDYANLNKRLFNKYQVIVLLAGHSTVKSCATEPTESFENNVVKFIELLPKLEKQKFIYASSYRIYGDTKGKKVTEEDPLKLGSTFYDLSKQIIDRYAELSDLTFYGLRFGSVSGFSPNFRRNSIINNMYIDSVTTNSITVSNPDLYCPILGVRDLCRAIEAIIDNEGKSGIYNLASFSCKLGEVSTELKKRKKNLKVIKDTQSPNSFSTRIAVSKFQKMYRFRFRDSITTILDELEVARGSIK